MARILKFISVLFFAAMVSVSVYVSSTLFPVYTAVEEAYNSQLTAKTDPTGFNTLVFVGCLIISLFLFCAAWCFGDIAQAAKKSLNKK